MSLIKTFHVHFQFTGINVSNISFIVLNTSCEPGWWIHASMREFNIDGSVVSSKKSLIFSVILKEVNIKMLKHNNVKNAQPCLAELNLNLILDGSFDQSGILSFEKLQAALENTKLTFYGGLYEFIKDSKIKRPEKIPDNQIIEDKLGLISKKLIRFSSLIPKQFSFSVQNTSFYVVRHDTSNVHDYLTVIKAMTLNWKISFVQDDNVFKLLSTLVKYELSELVIDTASERFFTLDQHSIDFKLNNEIVNIYTRLKSFKCFYNHCDIMNWIRKNLIGDKKLQLRQKTTSSVSLQPLIEKFMTNYKTQLCVELWNISAIFQLSNQQVSCFNLAHTKLLVNQHDESKVADAEILVESLCFYLDSNIKNISGNNLKKTHVRGSAFYIGVLLSQISDYGAGKKVELSAHTLRTEYSQNLTSFVIEAVKCFEEIKALKSHEIASNSEQHKETSAKSERNFLRDWTNEKIVTNLKVTDITAFFINNHNMCSFANLPEIIVVFSPAKQIVEVEKMQISFVDFSKNVSINR